MSRGAPGLGCKFVVVATITAWFTISNHCALGALVARSIEPSAASMPCHKEAPVPSSPKDDDTAAPCCKVLKATLATQLQAQISQPDFVLKEYPACESIASIWQAHTHALELDTGPPQAVSFSESVLERSILTHAPPFL